MGQIRRAGIAGRAEGALFLLGAVVAGARTLAVEAFGEAALFGELFFELAQQLVEEEICLVDEADEGVCG